MPTEEEKQREHNLQRIEDAVREIQGYTTQEEYLELQELTEIFENGKQY